MDAKEHREFVSGQLDRVMGFFPRVDAKASALFAIDTALLTVLCLNIKLADFGLWIIALAGLAAALILSSLGFVFRCSFPHLSGGERSLIYFREIASRTEVNFVEEFRKISETELNRDLLGQVWRNSRILRIKFDAVKTGFILTLIALVPWCAFVLCAGFYHGQVSLAN